MQNLAPSALSKAVEKVVFSDNHAVATSSANNLRTFIAWSFLGWPSRTVSIGRGKAYFGRKYFRH